MIEKILTVAELITLLQQQPSDLHVEVEGCDCYGNAGSVRTYTRQWPEKKTVVLIERTVESSNGV